MQLSSLKYNDISDYNRLCLPTILHHPRPQIISLSWELRFLCRWTCLCYGNDFWDPFVRQHLLPVCRCPWLSFCLSSWIPRPMKIRLVWNTLCCLQGTEVALGIHRKCSDNSCLNDACCVYNFCLCTFMDSHVSLNIFLIHALRSSHLHGLRGRDGLDMFPDHQACDIINQWAMCSGSSRLWLAQGEGLPEPKTAGAFLYHPLGEGLPIPSNIKD